MQARAASTYLSPATVGALAQLVAEPMMECNNNNHEHANQRILIPQAY